MDNSTVTRAFATLQALEKCHANSEKMTRQASDTSSTVLAGLLEQKKVLTSMRRVANRLNLEVARSDVRATHRSLQIFYGMNALVRPEILATFQLLAGAKMNAAASAGGANELH